MADSMFVTNATSSSFTTPSVETFNAKDLSTKYTIQDPDLKNKLMTPSNVPELISPTKESKTIASATKKAETLNSKVIETKNATGCGIFPGCNICSTLNYQFDLASYFDKTSQFKTSIGDAVSLGDLSFFDKLMKCSQQIGDTKSAVAITAVANSAKNGNVAMMESAIDNAPVNKKIFKGSVITSAQNMTQNPTNLATFSKLSSDCGVSMSDLTKSNIPGSDASVYDLTKVSDVLTKGDKLLANATGDSDKTSQLTALSNSLKYLK